MPSSSPQTVITYHWHAKLTGVTAVYDLGEAETRGDRQMTGVDLFQAHVHVIADMIGGAPDDLTVHIGVGRPGDAGASGAGLVTNPINSSPICPAGGPIVIGHTVPAGHTLFAGVVSSANFSQLLTIMVLICGEPART